MFASNEKKKTEAIKRMKMLGLVPARIEDFEAAGIVSAHSPLGGYYHLDIVQQMLVNNIEREHNVLVYLVIRSNTDFGVMDSFLFVSDFEDEWERDRIDIENNIALTYTYNHSCPHCSEFGSIQFKCVGGGIYRVM